MKMKVLALALAAVMLLFFIRDRLFSTGGGGDGFG